MEIKNTIPRPSTENRKVKKFYLNYFKNDFHVLIFSNKSSMKCLHYIFFQPMIKDIKRRNKIHLGPKFSLTVYDLGAIIELLM